MPSIHDVATAAGLSTATVSRALRGLPGVSEETRERVLEAASSLHYTPSRAASVLASGQTHTVAVVVPYVTRWYFATVVQGAEEVLSARGYDLLLYNLGGDPSVRARLLRTPLLAKRVDATLLLGLTPTGDELAWLERNELPVGLVGVETNDVPSVRIDDESAARLAVQHLLALGHRHIAYVGGSLSEALDFTTPLARLDGYRDSLRKAGVRPLPGLEFDGLFTVAGGLEAGRRITALRPRPTAVFAASDEMAIGVIRAARLAGIRVPEDLSVIGIDDHEMAEHFDLTTVRQPVLDLGRRAAMQLLARLGGADPPSEEQHDVLPVELLVRHTTGPVPESEH